MANEFIKNKIADLVNLYKIVVNFSLLAIKRGDYSTTCSQNEVLKTVFSEILDFVKKSCSHSVYSKLRRMEFDVLPEDLDQLKTLDIYTKLLSLKYLSLNTEDTVQKINLAKMSIDFNPSEEFSYIELAKGLYKLGKYPETIELCEYIKSSFESVPIWEILGDTYRKLGQWGKSVEAYKNYIEINDGDLDVAEKLEETYKEALEENYG